MIIKITGYGRQDLVNLLILIELILLSLDQELAKLQRVQKALMKIVVLSILTKYLFEEKEWGKLIRFRLGDEVLPGLFLNVFLF